MKKEKYFAVIDTETNYNDEVMSIGVVIAKIETLKPKDKMYYILKPESKTKGKYSDVLKTKDVKVTLYDSRKKVTKHLETILDSYNIKAIFAYNASFDYKHLTEIKEYKWFDIMKLAAYKQYNKKIPPDAECTKTGRLKKDYGVEPIMQMLSGNKKYREVHNALCDAVDELKIMRLLGHPIDKYACTQIKP